jgi:N-methylhydantoinase A/oxoprolinase/acetone carboxylase beta subunit
VEHEKCSAIVVAGYALQRNSSFVREIKKAVLKDYPHLAVVCSNEITEELNMYNAAETAVVNACLIPIITQLMDSVRAVLLKLKISSKLMIMKGDGSVVTEEYARERPIETILSGPAASVIGAKILTQKKNAVVIDIGGTTTDCAILKNGLPELLQEGIKTRRGAINVKAIDITTIGLGGDSRLDFNSQRKIIVGPERAIPICYLAYKYPSVKKFLHNTDETLYSQERDASSLDFWVLVNPDIQTNDEREKALIKVLAESPLSLADILKKLNVIAPCFLPIEELRLKGVLKRAALTPTDMFHIGGSFVKWDKTSAEHALEIFARMFGKTPEETFAEVFATITQHLLNLIISHMLLKSADKRNKLEKMDSFILKEAFKKKNDLLKIIFQPKCPIVAIGAPAELFVRPVQKHFKAKLIVPDDADVANAIGAVASEVIIREKIDIIPSSDGNTIKYITAPYAIGSSTDLKKLSIKAASFLSKIIQKKARKAGLINAKVKISISDRKASAADGTEIVVERKIDGAVRGHIFE